MGTTSQRLPLAERKRRQARARIVAAAEELFAEHGFNAVSVTEIADRADVGRTTFFRHFGDKQEVVFAQEAELMAVIAAAHDDSDAEAADDLGEATRQLQAIVLTLCDQATSDPSSYRRHYAFVSQNGELLARDARKMQDFAGRLADILVARGTSQHLATLASQIALACYQAGRQLSGNEPESLAANTSRAFGEVLALGDA